MYPTLFFLHRSRTCLEETRFLCVSLEKIHPSRGPCARHEMLGRVLLYILCSLFHALILCEFSDRSLLIVHLFLTPLYPPITPPSSSLSHPYHRRYEGVTPKPSYNSPTSPVTPKYTNSRRIICSK